MMEDFLILFALFLFCLSFCFNVLKTVSPSRPFFHILSRNHSQQADLSDVTLS